jgi:glycosyltransferase involved in cell wall biosynthesis
MTERLLLLSWKIPPDTSGSGIIVGNLAKQFSPEELVLAGEHPYRRPAVAWKDEWPEIVYLTTGWPDTRRGARFWRKVQFPALVLRCLQTIKRHRCTSMMVTFPSEEFLLAGYVTSLLTGIPMYAYFHNTYVEQRRPGSIHFRFAAWVQSRVFRRAVHTFVMSSGMVELYRERYPDLECSALVHSFNEDIPEFTPPPRPGNPPRFVLCGNVNDSCADAAVRMCAAIAHIKGALTIVSGTSKDSLQRLGILNAGVRYETVSRDVVLNYLRDADIVVLPHGFSGGLSEEEYRTIFPTKTIELLISGRPILAHAPPRCYLTRFLRERDCALVVDAPQVEAVLAGIERLRSDADLRSHLVRNALHAAESFRASRIACTMRTRIHAGRP